MANMSRFGRGRRAGISAAVICMVTLALIPGCSSPTPSLPSIPKATSAATRSYLAGPGAALIDFHRLAIKVNEDTPASLCRQDAGDLVAADVHNAAGVDPAKIPDQTLAELMADEDAALAEALDACAHSQSRAALLARLASAKSQVADRLVSDGERS